MKSCSTKKEVGLRSDKIINSGIYFYGGINDQNYLIDDLILLRIDVHPHTWQVIDTYGISPPPLVNHTISFLPSSKMNLMIVNSIILFGGRNDLTSMYYSSPARLSFNPCISNRLYLYNILNHQWIRISPSNGTPMPRTGHASVVKNKNVYIFGGINLDGCLENSILAFDIIGGVGIVKRKLTKMGNISIH